MKQLRKYTLFATLIKAKLSKIDIHPFALNPTQKKPQFTLSSLQNSKSRTLISLQVSAKITPTSLQKNT
jgi:hypothetical protein